MVTVFFSCLLPAQKIDTLYFMFNEFSKKTFLGGEDGTNLAEEPIYRKNIFRGNKQFYIYDWLFVHEKKMKKVVMPISFLKTHKIIPAEEVGKSYKDFILLKEDFLSINPMTYIVIRKNCKQVILYEVSFQLYIQ